MEKRKNVSYHLYFSKQNNVKPKPILIFRKYKEIEAEFKRKLEENNKKILFPRRFTSVPTNVYPHRRYLLLVKVENETKTILKSAEYLIEEKFYVYGMKTRFTISGLILKVFEKFKGNFTKVIRFKNKIVLDDSESLECILTKNLEDCQRLYVMLKNMFLLAKIKEFLFLGNIHRSNKEDLIKRLVLMTGLSHYQFRRNKTRH